jgi:hypothetical protein
MNMEKEKKTQRTRIEDLAPIGEELTEEHLRLVSGGCWEQGGFTCTQMGECGDVDAYA